MSRRPLAAALLIDHPAFPLPAVHGEGVVPDVSGALSIRSLGRTERRRCAAQLLAACSLAAEFDLWLGRKALERSLAYRHLGGAQAVVVGFPIPLTPTVKRLRSFDSSFEKIRDAAVDAIAYATGLAAGDLRAGTSPGYFVEGYLRRSLDGLGSPLDAITGRNLWAYQWQMPQMPEPGEVVFWKVSQIDLAHRIAGAAWLMLKGMDQDPVFVTDGRLPGEAAAGLPLILCGRYAPESLTQAERWARTGNTTSLVVGAFPAGWDPPGILSRRTGVPLSTHLAVTGVSLDRARREVDALDLTFDPANLVDRNALSEAARQRFVRAPRSAIRVAGMAKDPVHRALSLRREGLTAEAILRLSGTTTSELAVRINGGMVVADGDRYRLPTPCRLRRDPWHSVVSEGFEPNDPQGWLHEALGGAAPSRIEDWARSKLDRLENRDVRDLIGQTAPGELGQEVSALLAEACLAELDLAGARDACSALVGDQAATCRLWIDIVDHPEEWRLPYIDWDVLLERAPRVAAEAVLFEMRQVARGKPVSVIDSNAILELALRGLAGSLASWYSIEQAAAREEGYLFDAAWGEIVTADNTALVRFLDHKRAIRLKSFEHFGAARSILFALADREMAPGRLAGIFFDLSEAIEDLDEEAAFLLRALRLFEVAGFRHKRQTVLFNLAMINVEQLRLDRAEQHLAEGRTENDTQWSLGEVALTLARGDQPRFSALTASLPVALEDPRLHRSCEVFRGVDALLGRRFEEARSYLEKGGEDSEPWLAVLAAVEDRDRRTSPARDPWALADVCRLIEIYRKSRLPIMSAEIGSLDARKALGIAVADRLMVSPAWLNRECRIDVVGVLRANALDGWARDFGREAHGDVVPLLRAVKRLADTGDLKQIGRGELEAVLSAVGVTGLEVRSEPEGETLFRGGIGEPTEVVRHGCVSLAALGSYPSSDEAWGLLSSVFGLIAPSRLAAVDSAAGGNLGIIGDSAVIEVLREGIRRVAPSHLTVLLTGETGVGKELAARAIHGCSGRHGVFEAVNVAALPDTLFEAEMFGVVKGAYTGAHRDRPGVAEAADGGTLFLDEIGELGLPLQVKLLRFLDSGEVRRVGATRCRRVDVRVVAATNRDLEKMVKDGRFREDLYFRIACTTLAVPPLRDRGEDILLLRDYLANEAVRGAGLRPAKWSREAEDVLRVHAWPGNVRELRQVVGEALLNSQGNLVIADHLPQSVSGVGETASRPRRWDSAHRELRVELIRSALDRNGGNRAAAARELGITRQTLMYHMRRLGLQ